MKNVVKVIGEIKMLIKQMVLHPNGLTSLVKREETSEEREMRLQHKKIKLEKFLLGECQD